MGMSVNPMMMGQPQPDEEEEDEDMGVAETYADYMPPKREYDSMLLWAGE